MSVGERRIAVDGLATATVRPERGWSRWTVSVACAIPGPLDRKRHEVPPILVQLVGGQVDSLGAGPVAQLQCDWPGRIHVSKAPGGGPSGCVLARPDVRQKAVAAAVVSGRFRHPMVVQPELWN